MERLLRSAISELSTEFQVTVIGPKGCTTELPEIEFVYEANPYPLWRFLTRCLVLGVVAGRQKRPHAIFAGSGLTVPITLLVARLAGAAAVAQLHGLDLVARNPLYRLFFVRTFRFLDVALVNSRNTARLAIEQRILPNRVKVLHPGIRSAVPVDKTSREEFATMHLLQGKRVLLSVGRLTLRKGLSKFIETCMPTILQQYRNTVLIIAGGAPSDALKKDGNEPGAIRDAVDALGIQEHVVVLGPVSDHELDLCYANSNVFIFPAISVPGDVEGFGMVAVEAAARGIPSVAFDVGGISDAVDDGHSGCLVPAQDYETFARCVSRLLSEPRLISAESCINHAHKFSIAHFGHRLRTIFRNASAPHTRPDT